MLTVGELDHSWSFSDTKKTSSKIKKIERSNPKTRTWVDPRIPNYLTLFNLSVSLYKISFSGEKKLGFQEDKFLGAILTDSMGQ